MYMRYSELLASQPVTLDGEHYHVVRVAYHKTSESYSVQVALSCTPYSHRYAHVIAKVITLTCMETVRLLMNSNGVYVSNCLKLVNRIFRQCVIQWTYSNRDVILRGDDKEGYVNSDIH